MFSEINELRIQKALWRFNLYSLRTLCLVEILSLSLRVEVIIKSEIVSVLVVE